MDEKHWYHRWFNSPFYHQLYFERDEQEAEAFINQLVQHLNIPRGSRVLDAACGRGRHCKFLAAAGYQVTGIDIAPDSISFAKKSIAPEADNPEFFIHDMRLPLRGNYFDYILNLFTSFGYFRTRREHDDTIRTIAKSLRPPGYFIIDYLNIHYTEAHLVHYETKIIGNTHYDIHRWDDENSFFKKIVITDPSLKSPMEITEAVAKFTLGDFTDMLSYQGLQVQEVFGSYKLAPYHTSDQPRLIIIAKK